VILSLRPHHILCRLGYVGYGYSPEFIREMERTVKLLESKRVKTVILRPGFDNVCRTCPHHEGECDPARLGSRGVAAEEFDRRAQRALKVKLGHAYPLPEINQRIAALTPEEFAAICKGCEWQRLGACAAGHLKLRKQFFPEKK
jgi:uncharacterized protein